MTLVADDNVTSILAEFGGDPQQAEGLAEFLGFEPIPNPEDRLAGALSGGLKQFLRGRGDRGFGISELYRVGTCKAAPAEAGLWVGVLSDWGHRPTDRDRSRRRITRALVEHVSDRRSLALLVPPLTDPRREAELVFPRTQVRESGGVSSVRAHLDLDNPTRFHRDLLRGLRIPRGASLLEVSRTWQQEFSVERVTTRFYQEYSAVRDRVADALLAENQDHPVVKSFSNDDARAWATRQMGRVLFLWFLQAKRWLGEPGGQGSPTYLLDLWDRRRETEEGEYYRGLLAPMFFDAMATGSSSRGEHPVLGFVPYLNGGLFIRNALEDRVNDEGEVSLPDEVFDPEDDSSLLGLLSRYRFTTRESTPDDQSVDPDPELLGRVFENLYQGDERRKTGTYYTPREVVHFMCREVLDGYLRDATGIEQRALNALREESVGSRDEYQPIPDIPADALIDVLETVRICDPAVGSGAFLLGAIQEIVALRRGILFSQQSYIEPDGLYQAVSEWKRRIIERSLYGVDINPEAVEICRLRLWLSMVLDMDEPPESGSDWALPNLDFQIVAGDSLVDRVAGVVFKESWPTPEGLQLDMELQSSLQRLENNIANRRREFEGTHRDPKRLRQLRDLIARDQREIIRLHLTDALERAKEDLEALKRNGLPTKTALKRADSLIKRILSLLADVELSDFTLVQKPFLWPIAFPEVLREGDSNAGFDIVLANPPYVRMEKIDNEDEKSYGEAFPEVKAARADTLVYFYARALQILRPKGWLSFITSNKFMRAGYGGGLREHLPSSLRIQRVIDFGDLPLFESNGKVIAAYPAVLVGSRHEEPSEHVLRVADLTNPIRKKLSDADLKLNAETVRGVLEDLHGLLRRAETRDFPQVLLKRKRWILEDPVLIHLFERLMSQGTPLGEFVNGRIHPGVKTGLNEAFVIDQDKRDELIKEDPRSADLIEPWLRGKDTKRWKADRSGLYIIFTSRGVNIDLYPAIEEHLRWYRRDLENRATSHLHPWYELQQPQEGIYHEFVHPKIIWKKTTFSPAFLIDSSGSYLANTLHFISGADPWLAGVMNSSLMEWLMALSINTLHGGYLEITPTRIDSFTIPTFHEDSLVSLQSLVNEILHTESSEEVSALEKEIDGVVFDAYGVLPRERKLVLDWVSERREVFGMEVDSAWAKLNSLRASAGAWQGSVDGKQLKQDLRASRDIRTRPVPSI